MGSARTHHVYVVTHRVSVRHYVGKTSVGPHTRWRKHVADATSGRHFCKRFHRALAKYGHDAFTWQVIESFPTEREALDAEAWWIEFLRTTVPSFGFNIFRDGTGGAGHPVSPETRAMLRAANIGKKASAETRAKQSAMRIGRKLPPRAPEWSAKIGAARRREIAEGRRDWSQLHTAETKAKLRGIPKTLTTEQRRANSERCSTQLHARWSDPAERVAQAELTRERNGKMWSDPSFHESGANRLRKQAQAQRKLTAEQVLDIRTRSATGTAAGILAKAHGVSTACISHVVRRKTYTDLP